MNKKEGLVSEIYETIMHLLYESNLYGSSLWPKKSFKAGWDNMGMNDVICIGIHATPPTGLIQFNIYGLSIKRIRDQDMAIKKLFHQTIYNEIYFELEMEIAYSSLAQPHFNGRIGMVTSRFNFST